MSDNDKIIHSTLRKHLEYYRDVFTAKTFKLFTWIIVAFIAVDEIRSIKFVWDIFLRTHAPFCLNSVYYFLAYSPLSIELLIAKTAGVVLSLVPERLEKLPVFLIIDDTLQPKFGQHFAGYQEFFDHCKRTGNNYLKGNNFVCIVLSVPIPFREEIRWLSLPVGLWLYTGTLTKLEIDRKLIEIVVGVLGENRKAIILCDSLYTKGTVLEAVKSHENLQIIAGVKV